MNETCVEVKSVLWQKILASLIFLPFLGAGLACWLAPFMPIFAGEPPSIWEAAFYGTLLIAFGFGFWWTIMRYSIRADSQGIRQSNGFFRQEVRWDEVARYHVEPNRRFHRERHLHIEPVLFDSNGKEVFRGFAHVLVSTRKIIEQRRELWQFVETQLDGKKIETPHPEISFTPETLARRSMEVDWKTKTVQWKIVRIVGLVAYSVFWFAVFWSPLYYLVSHDIALPKLAAALLPPLLIFGPLLPWFIRFELKKRQIAREWETRDKIES